MFVKILQTQFLEVQPTSFDLRLMAMLLIVILNNLVLYVIARAER